MFHLHRRPTVILSLVLLATVLGGRWSSAMPAQAQPTTQVQCLGQTFLFVGSSRPLPTRDETLRVFLTLLGNQVIVRSAKEVQATDAQDKDLVIISESSESPEINTKLRDLEIPILTWEGWLQDDLRMVRDDEDEYGEHLDQTQILIVNSQHPLAAGYHGTVTTVVNRGNKFHWGKPNENAIIVARDPGDSDLAMIYAYEAGTEMEGMRAPARRVFIHNATGQNLTSAGFNLFLAAVDWAAGCSSTEPTPSPTATPSPTVTPSPTTPIKPTNTATATPPPTSTATATRTATPTPSPTLTATGQPTLPTMTATTATQTATATAEPTVTQPATTPTPITPPTVTPTATVTPVPVNLTLQKRDLLFIDADEDNTVSPGDTLLYLLNLRNEGNDAVRDLILQDQPDPATALLADSIQSTHGTVESGNAPTDTQVVIAIDELAPQSTASVSLRVVVQAVGERTTLTNQAVVLYTGSGPTGQQQLFSDDPDTQAGQDATITPLFNGRPDLFTTLYLPLIHR